MLEFVVVVEARADAQIATELAERIILEKAEWLNPYLKHTFRWVGLHPETEFSCWKNLTQIIEDSKERIPLFRGRDAKPDEKSARKILYLVRKRQKERPIRAVLLIRDLDNQLTRREGLERARDSSTSDGLEILLGTANPTREAWVLNGFLPVNQNEQSMITEFIRKQHFNPCEEADRLTSRHGKPNPDRDPKIVLTRLTNGDEERETACWRDTELATLRERGKRTGLTAYMIEIEERLLPIIVQE